MSSRWNNEGLQGGTLPVGPSLFKGIFTTFLNRSQTFIILEPPSIGANEAAVILAEALPMTPMFAKEPTRRPIVFHILHDPPPSLFSHDRTYNSTSVVPRDRSHTKGGEIHKPDRPRTIAMKKPGWVRMIFQVSMQRERHRCWFGLFTGGSLVAAHDPRRWTLSCL